MWSVAKWLLPGFTAAAPKNYQGVISHHNLMALHTGRFAAIYEQACRLDPYTDPDTTRVRIYQLCLFATMAKGVEGDFLTAGISYGKAERAIYEFLDFSTLKKRWHLVDPFYGVNASGTIEPAYNTDSELVRKQFPADAPLLFHRALIPDCLPLPDVQRLAFVHLVTGAPQPEAMSLSYLWQVLAPGGIIVIDSYAFGGGNQAIYDPAIKLLSPLPEVFSMVTGQGVIIKPSGK